TLIICGGGQLLDAWGGPWQFPYTIAKWVGLCRIFGVKCVFLNVGAGPLDSALGKWFIKHSLRQCDYVSTRDHESKALLLKQLRFRREVFVVADNAYALRTNRLPTAITTAERDNVQTIGIAPMAYCD